MISTGYTATPTAPKAREFDAFLQLDLGTHHAPVIQLGLVPTPAVPPQAPPPPVRVVSAGECTLRVWQLPETAGPIVLERCLYGRAGPRDADGRGDGDIRRFALSADGRWVFALADWGAGGSELMVFELATGNLQASWQASDTLDDLALDPAGRHLALARRAGANGAAIEVHAVATLLRPRFTALPAPRAQQALPGWVGALSLAFVPQLSWKRGGAALVVAGNTPAGGGRRGRAGHVSWWAFEPASGLDLCDARRLPRPLAPATLAVGERFVAVGHAASRRRGARGRIELLEHGGDPLPPLETESAPAGLAFSADGQRLLAGLTLDVMHDDIAAAGDAPVQVNVYALRAGGRGRAPFGLRSSWFGHDDSVAALLEVPGGRVLSSGGDDQALHLWSAAHRIGTPLGAARGVGRTVLHPGLDDRDRVVFGSVPLRLLPPNQPQRQHRFDLDQRRLESLRDGHPRPGDFESARWFVVDQGAPTIPIWHSPEFFGRNADAPPDLTLFVGADDEWVLWTRSGYFDASPGGARRIGYRVNRGRTREALFVPADRFGDFYRPQIVAAVVQHGSERRARRAGVTIPTLDIPTLLPPVVELEPGGVRVEGREVVLSFTVQSLCAEQPTARAWVLRNERFVWSELAPPDAVASGHWALTVRLPLRPGRNRFTLCAESRGGAKAVPVAAEAAGPALESGDQALEPPGHLFVLAVGVSDFAVAGTPAAAPFKRLRFAHLDAQALADAFAPPPADAARRARRSGHAGGEPAFAAVHTTVLTDARATKSAILQALAAMASRIAERERAGIAERDVLLVALAGHGVRYTGGEELYFWCHDLHPARLSETGLSLTELGEIATGVAAEVVLVVDTCHAAMSGNNLLRGLDAEEVARRIHAVHERGMYAISAARAGQEARESARLQHGVLTRAVLETLRSERHYTRGTPGQSGRVLPVLGLMAGVQEWVPRLSELAGTQEQTPVCRVFGDLLPLALYRR